MPFLPRTSLQDLLSNCYDLRTSAALGLVNTMSGEADATEVGSPTWASDGVTCSSGNGIRWPFRATGYQTIAVVMTNKPTPSADEYVVGAFESANECAQYLYWRNSGNKVRFDAVPYANYSTSQTTLRGEINAPAGTGFELFVGAVENFVGVSLYHPASSTSNTGSVATATHRFDAPTSLAFDSAGDNLTMGTEKLLMVARWARPLSSAEVSQFHSDVQDFYDGEGITVG